MTSFVRFTPTSPIRDQCYFLREYTSGRGYAHSETNRLIHNLKKPPDRRGRPEWRYKELAIQQVAREFRDNLDLARLQRVTLVPMPPSKARGDPLYDDRMLRVLRAMDVEAQLVAKLRIDGTLVIPPPESIAVVDDVLTTGAHFVAAKTLLAAQFPRAAVRGLFAARRAF